MTGNELVRLELGDRVELKASCENALTVDGQPMRWASHTLTGTADYVSTQGIYARYPIRLDGRSHGAAAYRRYYLLDGRTRAGMA